MLSSIQGPVLPRLGDGYVLSNMNLRRYYYAHLIFQGELVWAMLCFFQRTLSGRGASRCRRKSCWTGRSHYHYHHHHCHHNHYQTGLFSENNPCSEDPEYSFRACVSIWVARKAGCHLDWFRSSSSYVAIATLAVLVLFGRALKPLHFNANNALPQRNMSENYPPWTTKHNGNKTFIEEHPPKIMFSPPPKNSTACSRREEIGKYSDALTEALQVICFCIHTRCLFSTGSPDR